MSKKKYIIPPDTKENEFWQGKPKWFKSAHGMAWYERIDLGQIHEDTNNEDVVDLILDLINYTRMRDQVIEHREKVIFHGHMLLNVMARDQEFIKSRWYDQMLLIMNYLEHMTATSALDPAPPKAPFPNKQDMPGGDK